MGNPFLRLAERHGYDVAEQFAMVAVEYRLGEFWAVETASVEGFRSVFEEFGE